MASKIISNEIKSPTSSSYFLNHIKTHLPM